MFPSYHRDKNLHQLPKWLITPLNDDDANGNDDDFNYTRWRWWTHQAPVRLPFLGPVRSYPQGPNELSVDVSQVKVWLELSRFKGEPTSSSPKILHKLYFQVRGMVMLGAGRCFHCRNEEFRNFAQLLGFNWTLASPTTVYRSISSLRLILTVMNKPRIDERTFRGTVQHSSWWWPRLIVTIIKSVSILVRNQHYWFIVAACSHWQSRTILEQITDGPKEIHSTTMVWRR